MPGTAKPKRHMLTTRDVEIARWVGRWEAVTNAQVAAEFDRRAGVARSTAVYDRRMLALLSLGLVDRWRPFADRPRATWLTTAGREAAGLPGEGVKLRAGEVLRVQDRVDLALHLTAQRHEVVSGVELAAGGPPAEVRTRLRRPVDFAAVAGTAGRERPELVSVVVDPSGNEQLWLHEIHAVDRSPGEWMKVLVDYAYTAVVDGVAFWVPESMVDSSSRVVAQANRTVGAAGMSTVFTVHAWPPRG